MPLGVNSEKLFRVKFIKDGIVVQQDVQALGRSDARDQITAEHGKVLIEDAWQLPTTIGGGQVW